MIETAPVPVANVFDPVTVVAPFRETAPVPVPNVPALVILKLPPPDSAMPPVVALRPIGSASHPSWRNGSDGRCVISDARVGGVFRCTRHCTHECGGGDSAVHLQSRRWSGVSDTDITVGEDC